MERSAPVAVVGTTTALIPAPSAGSLVERQAVIAAWIEDQTDAAELRRARALLAAWRRLADPSERDAADALGFRCERRLGQLPEAQPKPEGGDRRSTTVTGRDSGPTPGAERMALARARLLASIPQERFDAVLAQPRPTRAKLEAEVRSKAPLPFSPPPAPAGFVSDDDVRRLVGGIIDAGRRLSEVGPERVAAWWLHTVMNGGPPLERRLGRDEAMERLRESLRLFREFTDDLAALVARLEPAADLGARGTKTHDARDWHAAHTTTTEDER